MSRYKQSYYDDYEQDGFSSTGNWWQDEENYYKSHYYTAKRNKIKGKGVPQFDEYGEFIGSNHNYTDLEEVKQVIAGYSTRTENLINSILGKHLTLKIASAYGIDKKNIYLNAYDNWLTFMTQDAFLGKVSQLLAKGLYFNTGNEKRVKTNEPNYMPLFLTLETARNYTQLANNFGGANYYLSKHWQEVGQYEVDTVDHDLLQGIFGLVNGDGELLKKLPQKAIPLIEEFLDEENKAKTWDIYEKIKPFFKLPPDKKSQKELEKQTQAQTNSDLTTNDKRNAQGVGQQGKKRRKAQNGVPNTNGNGWQGGGIEVPKTPELNPSFYTQTINQYRQTIELLKRQLQSILADNETKHYQRPFKRGKIDKKRLYKVAVGNSRIFKQLAEPNAKQYAFALCLDQSGSMGHDELLNASQAVVVMSKVLADLGLPFAVYGFSTRPFIYKLYGENATPQTFAKLVNRYDSTNDTMLFKRVKDDMYTSLQTCVLTITDGGSNDVTTARQAIADIEKVPRNKVYGIGIGGISQDQISRTYDKGVAIRDVTELSKVLTGLVRNQFRR